MRKKSEIQKENEEFVKTYDDSQYPKPSVTVDIVIFGMFDLKEDNYRKISEKKLKVLLIQRGEAPYEGCYALPGGFVHPEETIYKAAERELKEETNLNCNFLEQFGVYSNPGRDPRRWVISNGLMALMNGGQEVIQAGDDASDAKWFDVSFEKKDFKIIYRALEGKKSKLPVRILRRFKQELYDFTVTNMPTASMHVASIEDDRVKDEELVMSMSWK